MLHDEYYATTDKGEPQLTMQWRACIAPESQTFKEGKKYIPDVSMLNHHIRGPLGPRSTTQVEEERLEPRIKFHHKSPPIMEAMAEPADHSSCTSTFSVMVSIRTPVFFDRDIIHILPWISLTPDRLCH